MLSGKQPPPVEFRDFQPVDPWKSIKLVVSRKLPHLEVARATYFITFRCDSKFKLPPQARDVVMATIQAQHYKRIDLDAAVVMPDHVHAIFRLIAPYSLSQVLQQIRGRSSRRFNQILEREGRV
jgi:REP element-mobilizing transposase RayT